MKQDKSNKSNNVISDVDKLKLFLENAKEYKKPSKITRFSDIGMIFKWTNEKMHLYPEINLNDKKVLTITSSGDHALDAILKGATDIDSIDINIFCKYYSALKMAMIKKYDYYEFFDKITLFTEESLSSKKIEILEEICMFLTPLEIEFLDIYAKQKGYLFSDFFGPQHGNINKYNELKNKLDNVNINYYDADIINIDEVIHVKKYDCMYLSNVLERVLGYSGNYNLNKSNTEQLLSKLTNYLNDNGLMYNYFLGLEAINLEDILKSYAPKYIDEFNFNYYYDTDFGIYDEKYSGLLTMKKK